MALQRSTSGYPPSDALREESEIIFYSVLKHPFPFYTVENERFTFQLFTDEIFIPQLPI